MISCTVFAVGVGTMLIRNATEQDDKPHPGLNPEAFTLLLVLLGCGLVLVPEFFYLRDQFGWRVNTIFKFYFEAWIAWGITAAFGTVVLWNEISSKVARYSFRFALLVLLMSFYNRIDSVMLERLLPKGTGTTQVAIYAKAFRLLDEFYSGKM